MLKLCQTIGVLIMLSSTVSAELTYNLFFRLEDAPDTLDVNVDLLPGQEIGASIVLQERSTDPAAHRMANGLGGVNLMIAAEGSNGAFAITSRPTVGFALPDDSDTQIARTNPFPPGLTTVSQLENGVLETVIGTVMLKAPTEMGSTTFSLVDPFPNNTTFAGVGSGTGFPKENFRLGTATITAVPEPGSLLALSVMGLGGIVWHRRRSAVRRTAATA